MLKFLGIGLGTWGRRSLPLALGLSLGAASTGSALEIRTYSANRHDRFTGFPGAPVFNDAAWYGSRRFSGIGWIPGEGNGRQFALVSPRHVVFALHFAPANGTTIRFLNADGVAVDRTVVATEFVPNEVAQPTDLCLVKLSPPITAAEKVAHFPYLNLASESAYTGTALTIFGWEMKAGRGSIHGFEDSDVEGINTTRVMRFRYRKVTGNQDDARVVVGDSGSPSFGMAGVNPAILGVHTAAGETTQHFLGYDSFVPHYIAELDALMAPEGYRMTPAYPPAVSLGTQLVVTSPLKQAYAGSCRFDLGNTGANDAGNARFTLQFPAGAGPDAISAPGWIAETAGPQDWVFRRANLAVATTASFTATWAEMPALSSIAVEISRVADGAPPAMQNFELNPLPTFKAWADGLVDESETGDPDLDGLPNLVEYAFGGDPEVPTRSSDSGGLLLPEVSAAGGTASLRFPVRDDAVERGLVYSVEFSETLETDSWDAGSMPLTDGTAPFAPPVDGFLLRTVSWSAAVPKQFARVKVTLAE